MTYEVKRGDAPDPVRVQTASEKLEGKGSLAGRQLAIGRDAAPEWRELWRSTEHGNLLYGDDELPR